MNHKETTPDDLNKGLQRNMHAQQISSVEALSPQTAHEQLDTEQLIRVFNTALITTREQPTQDLGRELREISQDPSYLAIIEAVRALAAAQGINESDASEQMIHTFRKIDRMWREYVFQEGLNALQGPQQPLRS